MDFEWDERKNQSNLRKHRIAFEDAIEVFEDPNEVTVGAASVDVEGRWKIVGRVRDALVTLVFTWRDQGDGTARVRVISARAASRKERRDYGQPR